MTPSGSFVSTTPRWSPSERTTRRTPTSCSSGCTPRSTERSSMRTSCSSNTRSCWLGGVETTRNAIAGGMEMLAENPEQWAFLRANVDDDSVIEAATRGDDPLGQSLRQHVPHGDARRRGPREEDRRGADGRSDVPLGKPRPAGLRGSLPIRRSSRPARTEKHIAFGFGSHFCLGANLARLELRTALRALLRRFETVAVKPGGRHEWASSSFTRGPMHMDLVFG